LEKIFGCNIDIKNPELLQCKFSGKFKENNLDEILEVIAFALDLTINKKAGKQLTIIGKGCQQ